MQLFVVTLFAIVVAAYVSAVVRGADTARRQWGTTVEVLVATGSLHEGDVITVANSHMVSVPFALVARDALRSAQLGVHVVRSVAENQMLTSLDINESSSEVPAGWKIVAFPTDVMAPQLHVGDRVDIVAMGTTVVSDAIVVTASTSEHGNEIAVPSDAAAAVAGAIGNGDASVVTAR